MGWSEGEGEGEATVLQIGTRSEASTALKTIDDALDAFLEANAEPSGATTEMRAVFFFFQAVATVYGAAWDLFMDWSVVSLVRQTRDSEEVITGAEGGTNPSRARFGAAYDAKKTSTDLSLPRGYRLRRVPAGRFRA